MKLRDALVALHLTFFHLPSTVAGVDPSSISIITLTSFTTVRPSPIIVTASETEEIIPGEHTTISSIISATASANSGFSAPSTTISQSLTLSTISTSTKTVEVTLASSPATSSATFSLPATLKSTQEISAASTTSTVSAASTTSTASNHSSNLTTTSTSSTTVPSPTSPTSATKPHKVSRILVLSIVIPLTVLFITAILICCIRRSKRNSKEELNVEEQRNSTSFEPTGSVPPHKPYRHGEVMSPTPEAAELNATSPGAKGRFPAFSQLFGHGVNEVRFNWEPLKNALRSPNPDTGVFSNSVSPHRPERHYDERFYHDTSPRIPLQPAELEATTETPVSAPFPPLPPRSPHRDLSQSSRERELGSQLRSGIGELPSAAVWFNYDGQPDTPSAISPTHINGQKDGEAGAAETHEQPMIDLKGKSVVHSSYGLDKIGIDKAGDRDQSSARSSPQGSSKPEIIQQLSNFQNIDNLPDSETVGKADKSATAWPSTRDNRRSSSIYSNEPHSPEILQGIQADIILAARPCSSLPPVEYRPIVSPLITYPTRTNSAISLPEPINGIARARLDTLALLEGTSAVQESARIEEETWALRHPNENERYWAEGLIRIQSENALRTTHTAHANGAAGVEGFVSRSLELRDRLPVSGEEVEGQDSVIIEHENGSRFEVMSSNNGRGGFF
ncbi:hypothetical protein ACMFMG_005041 [Clarireedia jacksonii]